MRRPLGIAPAGAVKFSAWKPAGISRVPVRTPMLSAWKPEMVNFIAISRPWRGCRDEWRRPPLSGKRLCNCALHACSVVGSRETFMPTAVPRPIVENDLAALCREAMAGLDALLADATAKLRERVTEAGRVSAARLDRDQRAAHGLAWLATYVEAVRQLGAYAERMQGAGSLGKIEEHLVRIGVG